MQVIKNNLNHAKQYDACFDIEPFLSAKLHLCTFGLEMVHAGY